MYDQEKSGGSVSPDEYKAGVDEVNKAGGPLPPQEDCKQHWIAIGSGNAGAFLAAML